MGGLGSRSGGRCRSGLSSWIFLAPSARLVVEVDGAYHSLRLKADARRTRWLERRGYRIVRVSARCVVHELEAVLRVIAGAL